MDIWHKKNTRIAKYQNFSIEISVPQTLNQALDYLGPSLLDLFGVSKQKPQTSVQPSFKRPEETSNLMLLGYNLTEVYIKTLI